MTYLHCHMLQCYYAIWVRLKRSGANICTMEWGLLNTNSFHKGTLYTSIDNHALKISLFQIRRHQSWAVKLCVGCRSTINSVWKFCPIVLHRSLGINELFSLMYDSMFNILNFVFVNRMISLFVKQQLQINFLPMYSSESC